jgi:hypothetical protein
MLRDNALDELPPSIFKTRLLPAAALLLIVAHVYLGIFLTSLCRLRCAHVMDVFII